ncbi:MAG: 2-amino-4-hydroxy-6-hydroxymethyldihydropteridine diphosphokinase [Candidatus Cloacimonadaceae bacterium]
MIYHLILGSNLDEPIRQISIALAKLQERPELKLRRTSPLLESKAYGYEEQPNFWNQVLEIESELRPEALLRLTMEIENAMGRRRDFKWGPRNIDIDILLAEDMVLETADLTIPHADFHRRLFALELMSNLVPEALHPVLNKTMRQLFCELNKQENKMKALAAIVLAAGKGTRMKSEYAKVIFPIAEKPMVQRVVDTAVNLNCQRIAVVIGWQKESVIACLSPDSRIVFAEQTEQLGTGHAVQVAEYALEGFEGDVFILCGDVPLLTAQTLQKLYKAHKETGAAATVLTAILKDAGKYGRMLRDERGKIKGIVEYKDASEEERKIQEFNTGIYCFDKAQLFRALAEIKNENEQGEYYLTDTLSILYKAGEIVEGVVLEDLMEVSGVNSQEQLAELEDIYVDRVRKYWLNNGVMMHNPATIYIGDEVELSKDVEIGAGSILQGKCRVESGVYLGPNSLIEDATIGANCVLPGHNIVYQNEIAPESKLFFGEKRIRD